MRTHCCAAEEDSHQEACREVSHAQQLKIEREEHHRIPGSRSNYTLRVTEYKVVSSALSEVCTAAFVEGSSRGRGSSQDLGSRLI